jgi:transcriptional regulator with GAF, ATPase, and Fis domain
MARLKLKKLFADKNGAARALSNWLGSTNARMAIQDAGGEMLIGTALAGEKCAIELNGETLGWVAGDAAERVAALISAIAAKEAEKIALADEVLDKYREINLLYNLTEKLAATIELTQVASIALTESSRLIRAVAGKVILRDEMGTQHPAAAFGTFPSNSSEPGERIANKTIETGKGEIVNADAGANASASFLCAPLKAQDRAIGAILLAREAQATYTAADLKLLATVASQAAPPIENALLYEKTLREAHAREEQLKKQIEALQIQIDESRTAKQVAEITETDYFQALRQKADRLRYGKD